MFNWPWRKRKGTDGDAVNASMAKEADGIQQANENFANGWQSAAIMAGVKVNPNATMIVGNPDCYRPPNMLTQDDVRRWVDEAKDAEAAQLRETIDAAVARSLEAHLQSMIEAALTVSIDQRIANALEQSLEKVYTRVGETMRVVLDDRDRAAHFARYGRNPGQIERDDSAPLIVPDDRPTPVICSKAKPVKQPKRVGM